MNKAASLRPFRSAVLLAVSLAATGCGTVVIVDEAPNEGASVEAPASTRPDPRPVDDDRDDALPDCPPNGFGGCASGTVRWAWRMGGEGRDAVSDVAVDEAGNIFIVGEFEGEAPLGDETLSHWLEAAFFIVRLDPTGQVSFGRAFGATEAVGGLEIELDGDDAVAIAGHFEGCIPLDVTGMASSGGPKAFVASLDRTTGQVLEVYDGSTSTMITGFDLNAATGEAILGSEHASGGGHWWGGPWSAPASAGYSANESFGAVATIGDEGDFLLAGSFEGAFQLDDDAGPVATGRDRFIQRRTANNQPTWSVVTGATGDQHVRALDASDAGIVAAAGTTDQDGAVGAWLGSAATTDAFVTTLDASGTHRWSRRFTGAGDDAPADVHVDAAGNVLVVGSARGTIDFGDGAQIAVGIDEPFWAKLDPRGDVLWSGLAATDGAGRAAGVRTGPEGQAVIVGTFSGTTDLGGTTLTSAGDSDVFVVVLDP